MHARVATFNLGDDVDQTINQVRGDVESGNRPPGLEDAKGVMMLVDRSSGKSIGITFFDERGAQRDVTVRRRLPYGRRVLRGRGPENGLVPH
ncbi:MAG: hypothetical protein E6G33_12235 [Actinobacteria bacterium]|nr:MAG: hypothetical protein E6G33_12235 [Actinomycetota bacterium]